MNTQSIDRGSVADCQRLRIVFAGTPEFEKVSLQALLASDHQVVAVYTQPDRPAGRGRKLQAGPVKACALAAGVEVRQPPGLRDEAVQQELAELRPDLLVVVAYGLLLPIEVLQIPHLGCLNVHGSLLPRWRGAAPIHRAILAGDKVTGVTIMQMDEGLDTGDMLKSASIPITSETTSATLHDELAVLGAETLLQTLSGWCTGDVVGVAQPMGEPSGEPTDTVSSQVSYAHKLDKAESRIDWNNPAEQIHRQIMAFNPWPVAQSTLEEQVLRIWHSRVLHPSECSELSASGSQLPGTVLRAQADDLWVMCGDGVLAINQLQLPGKKPLMTRDFLNSRSLGAVCLGEQNDAADTPE